MPNNNQNNTLSFSRRKILAGTGAIGAAGIGAGLGTTAFFSDQETFTNNQLVAGELDLGVQWTEHYSDWKGDETQYARMPEAGEEPDLSLPTADENGMPIEVVFSDRDAFMDATLQEEFPQAPEGEVDDVCEVLADVPDDLDKPVIDLVDVKPGDFGEVTFHFAACDNPAFLWMTGDLVDESENGVTEPEAADPDEGPGVELADALRARAWRDDGGDGPGDPTDGNNVKDDGETVFLEGSLRDVLDGLSSGRGVPLVGNIPAEDGGGTGRNCFSAAPDIHHVAIQWWLPIDHGNEVQTDSVTFDIGFYAEQCRHNAPGEAEAPAVPQTQLDKLTADDGDLNDTFGDSVALDGDTGLIGAALDEDPNGTFGGSAYVFTRSGGGWSQQAKLAAHGAGADGGDLFGDAVALDGDTALIGAPEDDDPNGSGAGSAYVFTRSGDSWSQQAKLAADDGDSLDDFGRSVALDGDTALVGAPSDEDPNGTSGGSAYVFTRSGGSWSQQAKLAAQDAGADESDFFGDAVALDGETALIGANFDQDPNGLGGGSAYVFTRSGGSWSQQAKLAGPDPGADADDIFGDAVALDGDTALIGASEDEDPNGASGGSAYVFTRSGGSWSQQAKLAAQDAGADADDVFGETVALDGETALIGAPLDEDPNGSDAGSAYVFTRSGGAWSQQAKLAVEAAGADPGDFFGASVALDGNTALVGTPGDDPSSIADAGSAYIFGP